PSKHFTEEPVKDPSKVFKVGDVVQAKVKSEKFSSKRLDDMFHKSKKGKKPSPDMPQVDQFAGLSLEQDPAVQAALIAFDLDNGDVISMVGGANFAENEYNRALQAARQTGSSFKA